jgi:hypothetical protein
MDRIQALLQQNANDYERFIRELGDELRDRESVVVGKKQIIIKADVVDQLRALKKYVRDHYGRGIELFGKNGRKKLTQIPKGDCAIQLSPTHDYRYWTSRNLQKK